MIRKALIIYCNNTNSGRLNGPTFDNINFHKFLVHYLGGEWYENEIKSLQNPTALEVFCAIHFFLSGADYTFIIFTGHGFINTEKNNVQYLELADIDISILNLKTDAKRQTLIVDSCRGYYSPTGKVLVKGFSNLYESLKMSNISTRLLFDKLVLAADEGWSILYAASENQTALDTHEGAAYLLSLLKISENWVKSDKRGNTLSLNVAHEKAKEYLSKNFVTIQNPTIVEEKRNNYFPFAMKHSLFIS